MQEIQDLLNDKEIVAISLSQKLEPMEGRESPVFPATYPAAEKQGHRHDTPYNVNQLKDGRLVATLDSVQSQANRMEAAFSDELAHAVPRRDRDGRRADRFAGGAAAPPGRCRNPRNRPP